MNKTVLQNLQDANDAAEAAIKYTLHLQDAMHHAIEDLGESLRALQLAKEELAQSAETMGFIPRKDELPRRMRAVQTGPQPVLNLPPRSVICTDPDCPVDGQHSHSTVA